MFYTQPDSRSWPRLAELTAFCLVAGSVLAVGGCASASATAPAPSSTVVECDSVALSMLFRNQFAGLPEYVLAIATGTLKADELDSHGVLDSLSYWSEPPVDGCQILRAERPYDNPVVDIFLKRNRLTVRRTDREKKGGRQEFRWRGGLIVAVHYLNHAETPVLGIEELDPDGTVTRRVLHLDGRKHAFEFHIGPFDPPRQMTARGGAKFG